MTEPDYRGRAAAGITALQRWYRPRTGLWAALLHQRAPRGGYLTWAQRGWEWFSTRGIHAV